MESLAVKLAKREGELIQEKAKVKKVANFLKQVVLLYCDSDDDEVIFPLQ